MVTNFLNFSNTLSDVSNLSGTLGSLATEVTNFSTSSSTKLNELSGTVGDLSVQLTGLSGNVSSLSLDLTELSGTVVTNTVDLSVLSGTVQQNTTDLNTTNSNLSTTNSNVTQLSGTVTNLSNSLSSSSYGAVLSSYSGSTSWSYERTVRYDVSVPPSGTTYHFGNVPLSEVTFNLDYDNTYYFDTTQVSGFHNFGLSSTPYVAGASNLENYVTGTSTYTLLRVPRNYSGPLYVVDFNDENFGGVHYNKPYLSYGNYVTINGERNVRNKDQLLCLGDTTLYLPSGQEGYKFTFNVLSGTVSYYTFGSDTFFDGSTSGVLSDGGAVGFYTNNVWFLK